MEELEVVSEEEKERFRELYQRIIRSIGSSDHNEEERSESE
ncbi:MAG: hypothetical protein R3281_10265 [Balneolaceae bacterium]|nr:hypothetical protein [Balneolaceae bacterium]